jgi:hypothetical protein
LIPVFGIAAHGGEDDGFDPGRDVRAKLTERDRGVVQVGLHGGERIRAGVGDPTRQQFVFPPGSVAGADHDR